MAHGGGGRGWILELICFTHVQLKKGPWGWNILLKFKKPVCHVHYVWHPPLCYTRGGEWNSILYQLKIFLYVMWARRCSLCSCIRGVVSMTFTQSFIFSFLYFKWLLIQWELHYWEEPFMVNVCAVLHINTIVLQTYVCILQILF